MSFQYPLGLLGLIGIPILIIIYIIKSMYTEQTVSATYLWTLSEKFLKRKKKDNKITGIISLILQILAIAIISITIAHPVFTISGGAEEYCFVLDSTGSMNIETSDGKTRFDSAKEKIRQIVDDSMDGSVYTLISVSNGATTVFNRETDREGVLELVDKLEPGYGSGNFNEALTEAQQYFNENKSIKTYLITDKDYKNVENIELINVSEKKDNYALYDVTYDYSPSGALTVEGMVVSYEKNVTLTLNLYIDGENKSTVKVPLKKAEPSSFTFDINVESYEAATVKISNTDALALDNEAVLYNVKNENAYKTLLVSDTPFFLESVLQVVGNASVTVMKPLDYTKAEENKDKSITGYGLYVFHSCNPRAVPTDGSVWLINSTASIENSGFNYQGEIKLSKAETIEKTKASASVIKKLLSDVNGEEIYVSKYSKYDAYRNFNTLFTHDGNPVIFTGINTHGNREVVFAFDLHNSDMPLLSDYAILVKNLLDYSFPSVIEDTYYTCGDKAPVNVVSNCESIRVESPMGEISHLNMSTDVSELELDEVGVYTIKATINGEIKEYHIFSALSKEESVPVVTENEKISLIESSEAKDKVLDGTYSKLIIFFICLAVIIAAEWVVYCYDKYQLR